MNLFCSDFIQNLLGSVERMGHACFVVQITFFPEKAIIKNIAYSWWGLANAKHLLRNTHSHFRRLTVN